METANALNDEDFLVYRARMASRTDQYVAKAWLITARSLFPRSFKIQFESYLLEKTARNVDGAFKLLESMYANFPREKEFWEEVQSMLDALQSDSTDPKVQFLTEVFARLPTSTQCQMLLQVADSIKDVIDQCRLLLLAMKKFPNLVSQHGLKLVEMLYKEEAKAQPTSPVNSYRRLLVCQVYPVVLQRKSQVGMSVPELLHCLQAGIEFYITYIIQSATSDPSTLPELGSPTLKLGGGEREGQIVDPWNQMFRLMVLVAPRLGWEVEPDLLSKSRDSQWQYLYKVYTLGKQKHHDVQLKQAMFLGSILFLHSLHSYTSHIDTQAISTACGGNLQAPAILLEGFRAEETPDHKPSKRSHSAPGPPKIIATAMVQNSQTIIQDFQMAFKCFELLNSAEDICRDFMMLCQMWRMNTWLCMTLFQIDLYIFQAMFKDALVLITTTLSGAQLHGKPKLQMRLQLQLACCNFCMGKIKEGTQALLALLETLGPATPVPDSESSEAPNFRSSEKSRHLILMQCVQAEIFPYCIQLLIACLKDKAFLPGTRDTVLGHLLVLLQYSWSQEETLFNAILERIRQKGSFTYNSFFSYIFEIDILEEFAYLDYGEHPVNLDIMPMSTKTLVQQRTVTRGVNKGVKEDFRAALEKQARAEVEPMEHVLLRFLLEERESLVQLV